VKKLKIDNFQFSTMTPDLTAQLLLAAYAVIAAGIVVWQAIRFSSGWRAWIVLTPCRVYGRCAFRWRATRRCPLPITGPAIILANHRSPVDPILIGIELARDRTIGYMMAREYYETPVLHWMCAAVHSIPVERDGSDMASARAALRRVQAGELLGVFPEGRINRGTDLLPGNPGIAWLALRSKVPVYPVFIHNAPQGRTLLESFFRFTKVRVTYGDPIDVSVFLSQPLSSEAIHDASQLMMQRLADLAGVGTARDEAPPA
jgi:1-acyl-sn-glycerol-3-phosphate acyltransferase